MENVLSKELPDKPGIHRIVEVTVRPSVAKGQLEPDIGIEGWITSLPENLASDVRS